MILMFREPFLSPTDNLPCFMPNSISQHCVILSYPVSRWLPTTIQSSAIQVSFSEWSVLEKRKPGSCNLNQHNLIIEGCFFFQAPSFDGLVPTQLSETLRDTPHYSHTETGKHGIDPAKQRPVGRKAKCLIPLYDNEDFCHKAVALTSIYHLEMYQTSWYRREISPDHGRWINKAT